MKKASDQISQQRLSVRTLVQVIVPMAVGFILWHWWGKYVLATALILTGSIIGLMAIFLPKAYLGVDRLLERFGTWLGIGVTWLTLTPVYYLFFTARRVILTWKKVDLMGWEFPGKTATYWVKRNPTGSSRRYFRPF